ncbi:MAG: amino acid ABC transporter substrate-binding protein [Pseudomonadota bacterium]
MTRTGRWRALMVATAALGLTAILAAGSVRAAEPIRIGLGMALTGGLAVNGKPALLAMQIWAEDVNAKGGLLGRKVEFVYYDDQSNPSNVPSIYTKLLDVDKVDLVVGGYATNMTVPAMPIVMQRNLLFFSLFALAVNEEFHYPRYFSMVAFGPTPKVSVAKGFFDLAMEQNPRPKTLALVGADAEFAKRAVDGAREIAKEDGFNIVYDRSYPPNTVDYTPIVRAIQATNPDMVFVGSYPPDSVGMVRAVGEVGLKTKLFGGAMIGLQATAIKTQLGPLLNNIVYQDYWVPVPTLKFPGIEAFLERYQARAPAADVDLLGYFIPPYSYARMQTLAQAIEATGGLDQDKLADWLHKNTAKTVVGDLSFTGDGEWSRDGVLYAQFQGVVGNGVDQFRRAETQVVLTPAAVRSGKAVWPYR